MSSSEPWKSASSLPTRPRARTGYRHRRVVTAAVEELHRLRDDLDLRALAAVLGLQDDQSQPAVDADPAALREVVREHLGLRAEDLHVEEVRLVDPVAGLILLAPVHGEPEVQHLR